MKYLLVFCFFCVVSQTKAQQTDTSIFNFPIQMDEVVITAARTGWDVNGFIQRVKNDTTFYKAFKTLRVTGHTIQNDIVMQDKSGNTTATYASTTHQQVSKGCRTMTEENKKVSGDFYDRRGDYNYLTAELYAYLFFTEGKVCGETDVISNSTGREKGKLGKYKSQLKQLIFNPGSNISGVPFIGNKAAIFDPEVARMYQFKLLSVDYQGEECYLFQALPKPEYAREVVYNELSTWFRKSDYSILARDYSLSYKTLVFDFNVKMKVRLQTLNGHLVPKRIDYNGRWWAMTKGKENGRFASVFRYP